MWRSELDLGAYLVRSHLGCPITGNRRLPSEHVTGHSGMYSGVVWCMYVLYSEVSRPVTIRAKSQRTHTSCYQGENSDFLPQKTTFAQSLRISVSPPHPPSIPHPHRIKSSINPSDSQCHPPLRPHQTHLRDCWSKATKVRTRVPRDQDLRPGLPRWKYWTPCHRPTQRTNSWKLGWRSPASKTWMGLSTRHRL